MNIIKYMFYIGLFVTGYNTWAMQQSYEEQKKLVLVNLMENHNNKVNLKTLNTNTAEEYQAVLAEEYSQKKYDKIQRKAEAIVVAYILLPNAQNHNNNQLLSPKKRNKTLPIDPRRRLISQGSTPSVKSILFMDPKIGQ